MARRKKTQVSSLPKRREIFSSSDSYKSLLYGIITVVVLFIVGISLARLFLNRPKPEIDGGAVSVEKINEAVKSVREGTYTVQSGDSLWSIAENKFGDGFKWVEITRANKISNPAEIEIGTKLTIPSLPKVSNNTSGSKSETSTNNIKQTITENSYVVTQGDDLWEIAVRAYGDGYRWVEIARANNLANPDLIHTDNVLIIPR